MASIDKKDGRVHDSHRDFLEREYKPFRDNPGRGNHRETNRDDPGSIRCRVFIGNLQMSRKELEDIFAQYGKVVGCSVHNNYGFVQFEDEKAADAAVAKENGNVYYGKRVDVNLAGDRRKDKMGDRERDSRPPSFPPSRREREFGRDLARPYRKSPPRERPRFEDYDRFPSRFEAPYDRRGRSPSPPPPPRRMDDRPYSRHDDFYTRERFRGDPYHREPYPRHSFDQRGEPFDRDRRDPYDSPRASYADRGGDDRHDRFDSYSRDYSRPDEYPSPAKRPKMDYDLSSSLDDVYSSKTIEAPTDCVIVVMNKQQRGYAEMVERRLKAVGLVVELHFHGTQPISELLDDVARRGVLYAIVITSQHEVHRSVTVNILHGTPQEHRNMPLDDAMRLVGQNFDRYMQDLRERARLSSSNSTPLQENSKPAMTVSTPKEEKSEVSVLLSKAASGGDLSAEQLTKLIDNLSKRQEELLGDSGTANDKGAGSTASHSSQAAVDPQSIAKQQADLQAKILSILNPGGGSKTGGTSASSNLTSPQPSSQKLGNITPPSIQQPSQPAALSTNTKPIFPLYPAQKPTTPSSSGGYMSTSSSSITPARVAAGITPPRSTTSTLSANQSASPYNNSVSASLYSVASSMSVTGNQSQSFQFAKPAAPASQNTVRATASSGGVYGSKGVSTTSQGYSAGTKNLQGQTGRTIGTGQPVASVATSASQSQSTAISQTSKFSPVISQKSKFSPANQAIMTVGGQVASSPRPAVSALPRQPSPTGGPRMSHPMGSARVAVSKEGTQTSNPSTVAVRGRGALSAGTGTPQRGITPTRGARPSLGTPGSRMMTPRALAPAPGTGRSATALTATRASTPAGVSRGRAIPSQSRSTGVSVGLAASSYGTTSLSQGYSSAQSVSSVQATQKSPGISTSAGTALQNTSPSRGVPAHRGVPITRGTLSARGGSGPIARGIPVARGAPAARGSLGVRGAPGVRGALVARGTIPTRGATAARGVPPARTLVHTGASQGGLIPRNASPRGGPLLRGGPGSRGTPVGRVLVRGASSFRGVPGRGVPGGYVSGQRYGY